MLFPKLKPVVQIILVIQAIICADVLHNAVIGGMGK
jgi:hypothetical protein